MKHRAKRPKVTRTLTPPSYRPHRCALLAVDPGDMSGWAIYLCGRYVASGVVDVHDREAVRRVVESLSTLVELEAAVHDGDPCPMVLLLERPWSARSLGQARKLWAGAWTNAGRSTKRIARAWPSRWRAQFLGSRFGGRAKRDEIRAEERRRAVLIVNGLAEADAPHGELEHDECAAICQGAWGSRAGEVAEVLHERYRGAAA